MKESDSGIQMHIREIGQIPLLTASQELQLTRRIRQNDQKARKQMMEANLRLVVKIASDFESTGLPLLDLISEGSAGLGKAVDTFDPSRGVKFGTYAAECIREGIKSVLANSKVIRQLPYDLIKSSKVRKTRKALAQKRVHGGVARALNISLAMVSNRSLVTASTTVRESS